MMIAIPEGRPVATGAAGTALPDFTCVLGGEPGLTMQQQLARYRIAFLPIAEAAVRAEPDRLPQLNADRLAAVTVSFIKGRAVQSMIDPEQFEIEGYLAAAQGMFSQPAATAI